MNEKSENNVCNINDPGIQGPISDQLNVEQYRLSQDFGSLVVVRREIVTVNVGKPNSQSFIYVHPEEGWRMSASILELKEDREQYLVNPRLIQSLFPGEFVPKYLFTYQTRQGTTSLWAVRMPGPDGRWDPWSGSALTIINGYPSRWIRVIPNMELGAYEVVLPGSDFPPPVWPQEGFESLVRKAFRGKVIDSLDHPVIKRLRGEN